MLKETEAKSKKSIHNINELLNFDFINSLTLKLIIVVTITFIISAPIAQYINKFINGLGLVTSDIGAYINTVVNLVIINIIIIFFMKLMIIIPLKEHMKSLQEISLGNLRENIEVKGKDEFSKLALATNTTINKLNELIRSVRNNTNNTNNIISDLSINLNNIKSGADEVAKAVEEIATGTSEQAEGIEEGALKAEQLGEVIEKNQIHIKNLNISSEKVSQSVKEGLNEMEDLLKITDESSGAVRDVYDVILKTNESANQIGQASNVIASIADQTNLLALNAAIEAARAGDAGRGFAVVAEEIRKLAEQSSASTKVIDQVVSELQKNSKAVVETMEKVSSISKEQANSVFNSKDKYMLIAEAIKESEKEVKELNVSGERMEVMKNEIINTLQALSTIAEENAASTEEVTASIQEQASDLEKIASVSNDIAQSTENLNSMVNVFNI